MKKNIIVIIIVIVSLLLFCLGLILLKQKNTLNIFLFSKCDKGNCFGKMQKCTSLTGYKYSENETSDPSALKIDRKTLKCVMSPNTKYKLIGLNNIFTPSMFHGTYCDMLYTTYYDYKDLSVLKNRINHLNFPIAKCVRIRRYKFNPNIYFEIKYSGGTKIRALIDEDCNLLEPEVVDEEYKDVIVSLLEKIKNNTMVPLFDNIYKRLSFIYKLNPSIRITLDTNIEYSHNNIYNKHNLDILEIKLPINNSDSENNKYLKEINNLAGTNLHFERFSKFDYYYNLVMNS